MNSDAPQQMGAQLSAVCFGTLAQRGQQSRQAIWKFLDAAPQAIRIFDVNLRQGFYDRESILEGCQRAKIVKLNEEELPIVARELQLQESPTELQLRQFRAKFDLAAVVYTRGVRGTLMTLASETIDSPPASFPAASGADAVGAGDACAAGILVGFVLGWPPAEPSRWRTSWARLSPRSRARRRLYPLRSSPKSFSLLVLMTPKIFYFDLGNVLVSFSHERMCEQMAAVAGVPLDVVRSAVFGGGEASSAQISFETGHTDTAGYFDYFCRATGTQPDRRQLELAFCDIFEPMEETAAIVRKLAAAGHRVAILSNTNPLQWEWCIDGRYPALASFGGAGSSFVWAILSYEVNSMKPDRGIYDAAVRRAGVPAQEVFFVDDRADNVAGAKAAGLDAAQFADAEQLTNDLRSRGVSGL
jgi:glucose-1-phosphatase